MLDSLARCRDKDETSIAGLQPPAARHFVTIV